MVDDAGAARAHGDEWTSAQSLDTLLWSPLPPPRIRTRPWWFPVQELRDPLVFYLEAWLADSIFGPDRAIIPEMEWMSQVLLTVDIVNSGDFAEITIFGRPRVQNRVKSVLLNLASWHRKHRARAERMKQLEEFLKAGAPGPQTSEPPVAEVFSGAL
ncbi:oocyte-expressed protein homolog [Ursus arctos]|uniref:oocyte-expressed protein homolog n=1 Tax=Ursus arctos TaxID=9644 RepID=UPI00201808A1|nr:oocyte-expressed protein homolog [Ursus arctos]